VGNALSACLESQTILQNSDPLVILEKSP